MEYSSLDKPTAGAFRFNTDSSQLEVYDGNQWTGVVSFNDDSTCGERGICFGGQTPTVINTIQYITISSKGDSIDFGDMTALRAFTAGVSSQTRGISIGGYVPTGSPDVTNAVDYVTIASTGNSQDFGDITTASSSSTPGSNGTRGLFCGGDNGPSQINSIEYITIATTGNSADFGDTTVVRESAVGMCNSATRMLLMGGYNQPGDVYLDTIEYVTMATTGNSVDFGDLLDGINHGKQCSSSTRGIVMGGEIYPGGTNMIQYVTISSTGNAFDFGDLANANWYSGAMSGRTRGISFSRYTAPAFNDDIEYVQIATGGNAATFGNLASGNTIGTTGCVSNAHGGL